MSTDNKISKFLAKRIDTLEFDLGTYRQESGVLADKVDQYTNETATAKNEYDRLLKIRDEAIGALDEIRACINTQQEELDEAKEIEKSLASVRAPEVGLSVLDCSNGSGSYQVYAHVESDEGEAFSLWYNPDRDCFVVELDGVRLGDIASDRLREVSCSWNLGLCMDEVGVIAKKIVAAYYEKDKIASSNELDNL